MDMQRVGDLELGEDMEFERRSWRVERVGWSIFSLILLLGMLGVLGGSGPLATAAVGDGSPMRVEYSRFARHNSPTTMTVRVRPAAGAGDEVALWVGSPYLEAVQIERMEPEPERIEVDDDRLTYLFRMGAGGDGGAVIFHIMPEDPGLHQVRVGVSGGPEHTFSQVIYP